MCSESCARPGSCIDAPSSVGARIIYSLVVWEEVRRTASHVEAIGCITRGGARTSGESKIEGPPPAHDRLTLGGVIMGEVLGVGPPVARGGVAVPSARRNPASRILRAIAGS